jgi:hypothetical protein
VLGDNKKMAYFQLNDNDKIFNNNVVTDIAFDLTTESIIVRSIHIIKDTQTNTDGTYYEIVTIKALGENKYKTQMWCGEYVEQSAINYTTIMDETFVFTWQNNRITQGEYVCLQQTAVAESVVNEGAGGALYLEDRYSAERAKTTATITMQDEKYVINRAVVLETTDKSMDIKDVTETYRATQELRAQGEKYLLTETATGKTEEGGIDTTTQYVLFELKTN